MKKNNTKKTLIGLVILVALIAVFAGCYYKFVAKGTAGAKAIVIEVVDKNGTTTTYDLNTDAQYLKDAMDELAEADDSFSYSGTEFEYGYMVEEINGQKAIYTEDNSYWALYVNDEFGQYVATQQPVTDSDTYTWRYEKAE